MEHSLRVGDTVLWSGGFGARSPTMATVVAIERTTGPVAKYGERMMEVEWEAVLAGKVVVDLDNNHWAYGSQLMPLPEGSD